MALIICPECHAKISDQAHICPCCGFQIEGGQLPISASRDYTIIPYMQFDLDENDDNRLLDYYVLPPENYGKIYKYFSEISILQAVCPALVRCIQELATRNNVLIAKIEPYVQKLIDTGVYRLAIDKNNEILPLIRDAKGIVKQVRLDVAKLNPNIMPTINGLLMFAAQQIQMRQIISLLNDCRDAIRNLSIELLNDRYGEVEGAWDSLVKAGKIRDLRLKEYETLNAVHSAIKQKRILMRSYNFYWKTLQEAKNKKGNEFAEKALNTLEYLFITTKTECAGYMIIGEISAYNKCIMELQKFVKAKELNNKDTLRLIGEFSKGNRNQTVDSLFHFINKVVEQKPVADYYEIPVNNNVMLSEGRIS